MQWPHELFNPAELSDNCIQAMTMIVAPVTFIVFALVFVIKEGQRVLQETRDELEREQTKVHDLERQLEESESKRVKTTLNLTARIRAMEKMEIHMVHSINRAMRKVHGIATENQLVAILNPQDLRSRPRFELVLMDPNNDDQVRSYVAHPETLERLRCNGFCTTLVCLHDASAPKNDYASDVVLKHLNADDVDDSRDDDDLPSHLGGTRHGLQLGQYRARHV